MSKQFQEDSFDKCAEEVIERIGGKDIFRHIHRADRRELLGYLTRLLSPSLTGGNSCEVIMWQDNIKRPHGLRLGKVGYKTLLRCKSNRKYCVEASVAI